MTPVWQDVGATGGQQQPVGALGGYLPWLLSLSCLSPHAPSLKAQQPSLKAHPIPSTLSQQGWEAPRNPLGEIQSPDLILRTSHHRKEEKIMKLSTFQLAIFSTVVAPVSQGLVALQLFLPLDFRNCRPILVTRHHSQLNSIHSNRKKSKPQCTAARGHGRPYSGYMGPN